MEFLKREFAGLPIWAWGLIAVGGVGLGYLFLRGKIFGGTPAVATTDSQPVQAIVDQQPVPTNTPPPPPVTVGPPPPPPVTVGPPPPPPVTVGPPPPPPNPQEQTFVVTRWPQPGSDLSSIAQEVYGNSALWPQIYNANKNEIGPNPNDLKVGMRLIIPPKVGVGSGGMRYYKQNLLARNIS